MKGASRGKEEKEKKKKKENIERRRKKAESLLVVHQLFLEVELGVVGRELEVSGSGTT